jgi:exodeoxyribonuclease VII large subunit
MKRELGGWRETVDDLAVRVRHPGALAARARADLADFQDALRDALRNRVDSARRSVRELLLRLRTPAAEIRELRHHLTRGSLTLAHGAGRLVREHKVKLAGFSDRLNAGAVAGLVRRRHRLGELAARLDSLSPLRVLERGSAVVSRARDSRVVVDASTVEVGEDLQIRLLRGKLRARTVAREI